MDDAPERLTEPGGARPAIGDLIVLAVKFQRRLALEDLAACRDAIRPQLALYIGGMGARSKNYYNDLTKRLGYEAAASAVQDHFLAGRRKEAESAVPDALIDDISLVGTKERIHGRLQAWKGLATDHRIGTLVLTGATSEALRVVAEAVL